MGQSEILLQPCVQTLDVPSRTRSLVHAVLGVTWLVPVAYANSLMYSYFEDLDIRVTFLKAQCCRAGGMLLVFQDIGCVASFWAKQILAHKDQPPHHGA